MRLMCHTHKRYLAVRKPRVKGYLSCRCWYVYFLSRLLKFFGIKVKVGSSYNRVGGHHAEGSGAGADAGVQS